MPSVPSLMLTAAYTGPAGALITLIGFSLVILGLGATIGAIVRRSRARFWFGVLVAATGVAAVLFALLYPAGGA